MSAEIVRECFDALAGRDATAPTRYTLDPQTGRHGDARVPSAAWAGHADPVTGDVRAQLQTAADTT